VVLYVNGRRDGRNALRTRLSNTVIEGNNSRFSGTRHIPRSTRCSVSRSSIGFPRNLIWPSLDCNAAMAFSKVDLPTPFGPITVTICPSRTTRLAALDGSINVVPGHAGSSLFDKI